MSKCAFCEKDFNDWRGSPKFCSEKCNFMGSYKVENDCWIWRNANKKTGYGILNYHGRAISAHRYSYQIFKGEIPKKSEICHTCDNRRCVNPEHLFLGNKSINMQDAIKKGRFSNGEKHYLSKISEEIVVAIRELKNNQPWISYREIGEIYDISQESVYDIVKRRTWKHIP